MTRRIPEATPATNQLITELGGPAEVARMLNGRLRLDPPIKRQTVSNWKQRGIPYGYRAAMAIHAREMGKGVPPGFLGEPDEECRPHPIEPPEAFRKGLLDDVPAWLQEDA